MRAIGISEYLPLSHPQCLLDTTLPDPTPRSHDLVVEVEAISVNPVDANIRRSAPGKRETPPRILGWDVCGTVISTGKDVKGFSAGDRVYYSGDITRPGGNSELHLVDHRIAAIAPPKLTPEQAAALPLTMLTAWEALYERLAIDRAGSDSGSTILIIGGAGGVGTAAIQLAKLAGLKVIATASRPESVATCLRYGADHTINHSSALLPQLQAMGDPEIRFIANFACTSQYWEQMAEVIAPLGRIALIVEPESPLDFGGLYKEKSISVGWEFMFTRARFGTDDMARQGYILREIARLVSTGQLQTTLSRTLSPICADNLKRAHEILESRRSTGKIALSGW